MLPQRSTVWSQLIATCSLNESFITQSLVFVKHLSEGVSQKAPFWSLQLHLLIVFISPLPQYLIAQFPEEGLPHLGGEGDVCIHSVCPSLSLPLLQTLDHQPGQALPTVPAARHHPADPADARSPLTLPADTAHDLPLTVRHPHLPRCLFPLWGDLLCWTVFVLFFGSNSASWLKKRSKSHEWKLCNKPRNPRKQAHSPFLIVVSCH